MRAQTHTTAPRWLLILCALFLLPAFQTRAATALRYGEAVEGTLAAGEQAEYTFDGMTGNKPVISMNAHGGNMVPYVALYDPEGRLIGEDSGSGPKGNALLKGTVLPADGTYKIVAINKADGDSGKYGLLVKDESQQVYFDGAAPGAQNGKEAYTLSQPWDHTNVTYTIGNTLGQFNQQDVHAVLVQAFQSWANVSTLTFTEVQGRGDINVLFGPIDGGLNILGETCPPYNPCDSGSVLLDDAENWTLYEPQGYNDISLLAVASHEFGHAIGLLHTDDQNALMYPEYSPYELQPAQDDIAGVQRLYGANGAGPVYNPPSLPNNPPAAEGQMQVSGQLDDQHYAHFWDFDVVAGDTVTINMSATQGDLDSFLVLLDANNNVLAYDDDAGGGKNAQLSNLKFPQAGTYTVAATRYAQAQGYTVGTYSLAIQYDVGSGQAVATTAPGAAPPVSGTGSVKVSAGQTGQSNQLPSLDAVLTSPFAASAAPGAQQRSGAVSRTQAYTWEQIWCSTDAQTLTNSLSNINITFKVNGEPVDPSLVTQADINQSPYVCRAYSVTLSGWMAGSMTLTSTLTLKDAVFDGQTIYPPGDYVYEYDIQAS